MNVTLTGALPTLAAHRARLAPAESLSVFRSVLAAASRPGQPVPLSIGVPARGAIPATLLPVLAIADLDVTVHVLGDDGHHHHRSVIVAATGAGVSDTLMTADLVVALRPPTSAEIASIERGDALAPERGARLFVTAEHLAGGPGFDPPGRPDSVTVLVKGPGCTDGRVFTAAGIGADVFTALAQSNAHFPAGVDTWFVSDRDRTIVAIPRSSRISIVPPAAPAARGTSGEGG